MRILVIGLLIATMLLAGCATTSKPVNTLPTVPDSNPSSIGLPGEPPIDVTWMSPGKVNVDNFYAGARAEYPVTIHNGNDTACSFMVSYRYPDHVDEEYAMPPQQVQDWVIIAVPMPVLMPKETRDILVVLAMPEDAAVLAPKFEFWISVIDTTQTGMVRTELCSRWLVAMGEK